MNSYYITHALVFIAGFILFIFPPNKVNSIYGYRTSSSMKNDNVFKFANKFSSKLLMLFTFISFIICLIADELFHLKYLSILILLVFGLTILLTEIKLKKINNNVGMK
jgi:uncharacterized membrane protein